MARRESKDRQIKTGQIRVRAVQAIALEVDGDVQRYNAGDEFTVSQDDAARCGAFLEPTEPIPAAPQKPEEPPSKE